MESKEASQRKQSDRRTMKLSIITVNLNNRDGLKKTIDSIVSQTFRDYEWIVIDGGSTDGSKELIEQYADHFAYWVSEPDKGIYNAMNKGIKVAKGEYLQFLNSGDWLCDDTVLERCFRHGFDADVVYGDLFFCSGENKELFRYPKNLSLRFLYKYSLGHPASFIKREILQSELYDESLRIVSDWKFFLVQALNNRRFEHLDETISCFDMNGISSSNEDLMDCEREKVIRQEIPDMLAADYRLMDEMEVLLNQDRVKKVIEYSKKKKLYRKMISGCLRLVAMMEGRSVYF